MIAYRRKRIGQSPENAFTVVVDHRRLPVLYFPRMINDAPVYLGQALVPQAHPQYRYLPGEVADHPDRTARLLRRARSPGRRGARQVGARLLGDLRDGALGVDQVALMQQERRIFVVTGTSADFLVPARLNDEIVVTAQLAGLTRATFDIEQNIYRDDLDGELLLKGSVRAAYLDADTMRPKRVPASLFEEEPS